MKIRPVSADTFNKAMEMVDEVNTLGELLIFIRSHFPHWDPDSALVSIETSESGDTHVISIDGKVVLHGDGPFNPVPKCDEDPEKRQYALELMGHPLNRQFFQHVLRGLKDDGKYFWPGMMMEFTRAEIQQVLEAAEKEEN